MQKTIALRKVYNLCGLMKVHASTTDTMRGGGGGGETGKISTESRLGIRHARQGVLSYLVIIISSRVAITNHVTMTTGFISDPFLLLLLCILMNRSTKSLSVQGSHYDVMGSSCQRVFDFYCI